jgi:hypothetical protein
LQAYSADVTLSIPRIVGTVGTRYTRMPQGDALTTPGVIIPYFVQVPGTFNPGNSLSSSQATNFLQGETRIELLRNFLFGRLRTNFDVQTGTNVESRFGLDFKFDCWAFSVDYIKRSPDRFGGSADNEFRFSLSLLGVGNIVSTGVGGLATDSEPRFR